MILKIFEFSFILDQCRVCISNCLEARDCQSEPQFWKNAYFSIGLQTDNGNVFTHSYAISKQMKLELPELSQLNDFS